ncbi:MAG: CarD family transcriptional regulator [Desulfatiglandales bacterium]
MFSVGDIAVYPAHGVGVIENIETKEISGNKQDFYIMRILENGMKIFIPTKNAKSVGLRSVVSQAEVDNLYEILRKKDVKITNQSWNRRYREYMEKIKTGSIYDIAEVYRNLNIIKAEKELSFGERKILETARSLLVKELAIAKCCKEEDIEKDLEELCNGMG